MLGAQTTRYSNVQDRDLKLDTKTKSLHYRIETNWQVHKLIDLVMYRIETKC